MRNLNQTRGIVANFRQSSNRCEYDIGDSELIVAPEGGELHLEVAAEDRCEWDVSAFGTFLTADTESGAGTGSLALQVQPNEGGARIGYVTLAGETLVVKQRSETAHHSVCDRSTPVRDAILSAVGEEACDAVDEFDLLAVGELDFSNLAVAEGGLRFEERDLRGLGQLAVLVADHSGIEALPAGLFEDLGNLRRLELRYNHIADLDDGVFAGLGSLEFLDLTGNRLHAVPGGVFADAGSLEILRLWQNRIASLDAASLEGLAGLLELDLSYNDGLTVSPGTFREMGSLRSLSLVQIGLDAMPGSSVLAGLSNLRELHLEHNSIATVPDDAFADTPLLESLSLAGNAIASLGARAFGGLDELFWLSLSGNPLDQLPEEAFARKPQLAALELDSMALGSLPGRVFEGLDNLWQLDLSDNDLDDLAGVAFPGATIGVIDLGGNELASLPAGMFDGFTSESCYQGDLTLDLRRNPGAPFALAPHLDRVDGGHAAAGPASVALVLPQGAPVPVELEIEERSPGGGWRLVAEATIPNGGRRSEPFEIGDDGRTTLRVRDPSGSGVPITVRGLEIAGGETIGLFGFADATLAAGNGNLVLDLAEAFGKDGTDGAARTFSATSSDDAVATVSLSGGTLTVVPAGTGSATITITVGEPDGTELVRSFAVTVEGAAPPEDAGPRTYVESIPYFPSASDPDLQGFVRVVNHADQAGEVSIRATDDAGTAYDAITLAIGAGETVHFNSDDLEGGNDAKGMSGGVGAGEGDWRLEIESELHVEALAYVRTPRDGFLTAMMDTVPRIGQRHRVPVFNPGSNANQASRLRLVNPGDATVAVEVTGIDDAGNKSIADLTVAANGATIVTAAELEEAGLGDGQGKWQLVLSADGPLTLVNLMSTPTGHVTNLSGSPRLLWRGLVVEAESRCPNAHYDPDEYGTGYGSKEDDIVDELGGIFGPYTGTCYESTDDTTVGHMVGLQEAHFSGMCFAARETKRTFASDILNLTLASAEVNSAKGSSDAVDWMPETNQCWFAKRVLDVKLKYGMTADRGEAEALETVLEACESTEIVKPACLNDG